MTDARQPTVAVVIPNLDGRQFLGDCIATVQAQNRPTGLSIVVVDNGSTDGSDRLAEAAGATVLRMGENLGFAAAANAGARACETDLVAFLNNDMAADPAWLMCLVRALVNDSDLSCVGGVVLDRRGERVDFLRGRVNVHGFADQPGFGTELEGTAVPDIAPALFACGGSMLVRRDAFEAIGGFDETYFAYFEDVDFGWRSNLLGHRVAIAGGAMVRHHHHGTSRRMTRAQRHLLLERNALRTIIKNVGEHAFPRTLAAATLLAARRADDLAAIPRRRFVPFARPGGAIRVPDLALAPLIALSDVAAELDSLMEARRKLQSARVIPDEGLAHLFDEAGTPIGATSPEYVRTFEAVLRALDLGVAASSEVPAPRRTHPRATYLVRQDERVRRLLGRILRA